MHPKLEEFKTYINVSRGIDCALGPSQSVQLWKDSDFPITVHYKEFFTETKEIIKLWYLISQSKYFLVTSLDFPLTCQHKVFYVKILKLLQSILLSCTNIWVTAMSYRDPINRFQMGFQTTKKQNESIDI